MKHKCSSTCNEYSIDIFDHQFNFSVGRRSLKQSSILSKFLSYLLISTLLIYFVLISLDCILKRNPKISVIDFDVENRPSINLNKNNFKFAFKINSKTRIFNHTEILNYFNFGAVLVNLKQPNTTLIWDFKPIEIGPCEKKNFEDYLDYFDFNLKNAFCIKNFNNSLYGFIDEQDLNIIELQIRLCDPKKQPSCKIDQLIINNENDVLYFNFFIESPKIDTNNYEFPKKKAMINQIYGIKSDLLKRVTFYIDQIQLKTKDSLFYNIEGYESSEFHFKMKDIIFDIDQQFNRQVIIVRIVSSNSIQIIERNYKTLLDTASTVGGISKFIIILFALISVRYNRVRLDCKLLNSIYYFDTDQNNYGKDNQSFINERSNSFGKNIESDIQIEGQIPDSECFRKDKIKSDKNIKKEEDSFRGILDKKSDEVLEIFEIKPPSMKPSRKKTEGKILNFSFFEYFRCFIFPFKLDENQKFKRNLFIDSTNCLSHYKDITNVISILQQIELLKKLLFSKEQLVIFTFLSKPTFTKNFVENQFFNDVVKSDFENSIIKYYKSRQSTSKLDEMDFRLYENLSNVMKENINSQSNK